MNLAMLGPGGFRFLLAMLVVFEHVSRFKVGVVAVMAFFALSGYWVSRVFDRGPGQQPLAISTFYLSRFLRIWPLYITIYILFFASAAFLAHPIRDDIWIAIPIFGVATHGIDLIGVTWSLDIELQFYLLLPLIMLFLRTPTRGIEIIAHVVGFSAAWGAGLYLGLIYGIETVFFYLPIFLAGVALYRFNINTGHHVAMAAVCAFCLVGIAAAVTPSLHNFVIRGSGNTLNDKLFALFWVLPLLPFIAFNVQQRSGRIDRHLGNISYTIYLVHFPLTWMPAILFGRSMTDPEKLIYILVVLAFSLAIYLLLELRFESWRRRIIRYFERTRCTSTVP